MNRLPITSINGMSAVLFGCLFAAQASLVVISPILTRIAADFDVSAGPRDSFERSPAGWPVSSPWRSWWAGTGVASARSLRAASDCSPSARWIARLRPPWPRSRPRRSPSAEEWHWSWPEVWLRQRHGPRPVSAAAELLAYAGWTGGLIYAGAVFADVHGASISSIGVLLGIGAAAYIPATSSLDDGWGNMPAPWW